MSQYTYDYDPVGKSFGSELTNLAGTNTEVKNVSIGYYKDTMQVVAECDVRAVAYFTGTWSFEIWCEESTADTSLSTATLARATNTYPASDLTEWHHHTVTWDCSRDLGTVLAITNATRANPCVISAAGHGLSTGDPVTVSDVEGMEQLNEHNYLITVIDVNTFSIGVDSSGYGTYTTGGYATLAQATDDIYKEAPWFIDHGEKEITLKITNPNGLSPSVVVNFTQKVHLNMDPTDSFMTIVSPTAENVSSGGLGADNPYFEFSLKEFGSKVYYWFPELTFDGEVITDPSGGNDIKALYVYFTDGTNSTDMVTSGSDNPSQQAYILSGLSMSEIGNVIINDLTGTYWKKPAYYRLAVNNDYPTPAENVTLTEGIHTFKINLNLRYAPDVGGGGG